MTPLVANSEGKVTLKGGYYYGEDLPTEHIQGDPDKCGCCCCGRPDDCKCGGKPHQIEVAEEQWGDDWSWVHTFRCDQCGEPVYY